MTDRAVHVVVVAYGAPEQLGQCLAALKSTVEVTVVDNSSSALVSAVAHRWRATYIDPDSNLGFAAGVNLALRRLWEGPPKDVLLLNPDAVLVPRDIETLAGYLHRQGNEHVAAVAPCLVGPDGGQQRVVWPFPSPIRAVAEALGFFGLPARETFVIGAVLMLRWEALHAVGFLDERFFLYAEEVDWQRRASASGWMSSLCEDAVAMHAGAGTSDNSRRREALFHAAHETYVRKWYGRAGWCVYRSAACLGAALRALVLRGERRHEAVRRALLYFLGPRRCAALTRE